MNSNQKTILKLTTQLVGSLLIVAIGMFYNLTADWFLKCPVEWLFLFVVTSVGASVCGLFAMTLKDKPVAKIILKSACILLTGLFVMSLFLFKNTAFFDSLKTQRFKMFGESKYSKDYRDSLTTIAVVGGIVAVAVQIADLVLTVTLKEE